MNWRTKILSLIIIFGFTFWIHNDRDTVQFVSIISIDHGYILKSGEAYKGTIPVFTGEVRPGEIRKEKAGNLGRYIVTWYDYRPEKLTNFRELRFIVKKETRTIILRANSLKPEMYN